jgi:hypothetical protein
MERRRATDVLAAKFGHVIIKKQKKNALFVALVFFNGYCTFV